MKIFLSWSGNRSKAVATLLSEWLPRVIQSARPWISTRDIEKGSLWSEVISGQLGEISTGIICLTKDNKEKPWISFEAGALAKGISTNRVCTLLIDLEPTDVQGPLAQFNHTRAQSRADVVYLIETLNDRLGEHKLQASILENAVDVHWNDFAERLKSILETIPAEEEVPERSENDILKEILENTRSLNNRVNDLELSRLSENKHKMKAAIVSSSVDMVKEYSMIKNTIKKMKDSGIENKYILDNLKILFPSVDVFFLKEIVKENIRRE